MTIAIRDWTKQIEDLQVLGLDQLHETYSEMLATAHDIGYVVPDDQLVETDDDTILREVIEKLHPAIVAFAAENDRTPKAPEEKPAAAAKRKPAKPKARAKAAKETATPASPKKPAKAAAQKGDQSSEDSDMTATKKTAKKAAKKAPAKVAKGKKASADNARTPVSRSKFKDDQVINVKLKENPAKAGSGRHDRVANLMKHNGKTVGQFYKSGGKTGTLSYSVEQGWITIK